MVESPEELLRSYFSATPGAPVGFKRAQLVDAGAKARGLLNLPSPWYPPSIIVSPQLHSYARAHTLTSAELASLQHLPEALRTLAESGTNGELLLRSNADTETIENRGTYISFSIGRSVEDLMSGIARIWKDADSKLESSDLGFVIQPNITPHLHGHLSNEQRVSREARRWVYESGSTTRNWRVQRDFPASEQGPIFASTVPRVEHALRSVARTLSDRPTRLHLEWLWDGRRVWIVQADPVPSTPGKPPGEHFDIVRGDLVSARKLKVWREYGDTQNSDYLHWPKLQSVASFRRAGFGQPPLWVLTAEDAKNHLTDPVLLREDLRLLTSGDLILRTDLAGSDGLRLNLPKTPTLNDADQALKFITSYVDALERDSIDLSRACFIAHRLVRARASAWVAASPDRTYVRVDSLWGFADGLQFLPHDTSWVNTDNGHIDRTPVAKTDYLDAIAPNQPWEYISTPSEWIWKYSATKDQLDTIATSTRRLAEIAEEPVAVMWFVGVLDGYEADCVAWVQAPVHDFSTDDLEGATSAPRPSVLVRNAADLKKVQDAPNPPLVKLRPVDSLLRNDQFLTEVARVSIEQRAIVEIVGSPLAHAYYVLRKRGVTVVCSQDPPEPRQVFSKLVRDGIVEHIQNNGERASSYAAVGLERLALLKRKLIEEAIEVLEAEDQGGVLEELADVEEVLLAIRSELHLRRSDVEDIRVSKRDRRGGFTKGLVLLTTGGHDTAPPDEVLFDVDEFHRPAPNARVVAAQGGLRFSLVPPPLPERAPFTFQLGSVTLRGQYSGTNLVLEAVNLAEPMLWGDEPLFEGPDSELDYE